MSDVDILIPTYRRAGALAVTLTALWAQTLRDFRVVIADQSEDGPVAESPEVANAVRLLRSSGRTVEVYRNLPRRGMAHQRQSLLDRAAAPHSLFLDDDVVLEPDLVERLLRAIREQGCGFVGSALIGLSYEADVRPHQQAIELWEGRVTPEKVTPESPAWTRHVLHNAANILHVQRRLGITAERQRVYRVAWVGGCVLYDTRALIESGGFRFWEQLPAEHCGEDVLAQLRVMARHGGCGLIPSGAYHQELPTTITERDVDAPLVLPLVEAVA